MRISNLSNKSGNPSAGDYLVLDDGTTVTKIDYNKLAKAIIENYAGSNIAGSTQTLKAALDSLNSNSVKNLKGFSISANSSITLHVNNNSRIAIFATINNTDAMAIFLLSSTSAGAVHRTKVGTAPDINITAAATNSITITNSLASGGGNLYAMCFIGDISEAS